MWTILESILFGTVYTYINKSMGMYIVIHIKNKKKTQMQFKDETRFTSIHVYLVGKASVYNVESIKST